MIFSVSFVGESRSAEGDPNPPADLDRGGPCPLADLDRGVPYPLGHRLSGFNELAGWPPLHQIAKDSISKNIFHF